MLDIVITNVYSQIKFVVGSGIDPSTYQTCIQTIYDKMSFFDEETAKFSERYNTFTPNGKRIWDGYVHFFNKENGAFLTGHLPFITTIIDKFNIKYQLIPKVESPSVTPELVKKVGSFKMREYQVEGIKQAILRPRGIFDHATAAGKTIMAVGITESIPVKTLFLVDREELLNQTFDKFRKNVKRSVGVITSAEFEPRDITVAMHQTLHARLKNKFTREEVKDYLDTVEMLFADECHKASSPTWRYTLRQLHSAYYRYGLSGTPMLDNKIRNMYTIGLIGRIIHQVPYAYLIERGYVANPTIYMLSPKPVYISSVCDYGEIYRIGIVENEDRNQKIADCIKKHQGKSILVLVKQIEHGHKILKLLESEGYFVSGKDTKSDRLSIYNRFSSKRIPVVIASLIYKEGIDIPAVDVLIYAVGEKAPVTILQSLGRGMRVREDKKELICYDFYDTSNYHLKRHTNQRLDIYKSEKFTVKDVQNLEELGIEDNN